MLLTLAELQTRFEVILKLNGKDTESVDQVVQQLRERAGANFDQLFKTVTSDNGSEFSGLHDALQDVADVYFSHPYASWERGTSENQHKLIRRFVPKGSPISEVSENQILRIQRWMNDTRGKFWVMQHHMTHLFKHSSKNDWGLDLSLLDLGMASCLERWPEARLVGRLPSLSSISEGH